MSINKDIVNDLFDYALDKGQYLSIIEIIDILLTMFGNDKHAVLEWLNHYNHYLDNIPIVLIKHNEHVLVLNYLKGVESE